MRTKMVLVLAVSLVATTLASAQGRGGLQGLFNQPSILACLEKVQKDLKLTGEQIKKIGEAREKTTEKVVEAFSELQGLDRAEQAKKAPELFAKATADLTKVVKETLKPEQMKRLKQIGRQQAGALAFQSQDVQKELKLTADQKDQIKKVGEETIKEMTELRSVPREERAEKGRELRKKSLGKVVAVLNDGQKKTWKDLTGEPLTLTQEDFAALMQR